MSVDIVKPVIGPSAEELAELQQANEAASEVTNTVLSQRLELDEKTRTVGMLQKALVGEEVFCEIVLWVFPCLDNIIYIFLCCLHSMADT